MQLNLNKSRRELIDRLCQLQKQRDGVNPNQQKEVRYYLGATARIEIAMIHKLLEKELVNSGVID